MLLALHVGQWPFVSPLGCGEMLVRLRPHVSKLRSDEYLISASRPRDDGDERRKERHDCSSQPDVMYHLSYLPSPPPCSTKREEEAAELQGLLSTSKLCSHPKARPFSCVCSQCASTGTKQQLCGSAPTASSSPQ